MREQQSALAKWITSAEAARTLPTPPAENDDIPSLDHARQIVDLKNKAIEVPASERDTSLIDLYAAAADLAESILLPAILRSPHMLFGSQALDFREDLHEHLAMSSSSFSDNLSVTRMARSEYPTDFDDPGLWQTWIAALCDLLIDRAEAHQAMIGIIAERLDAYEGGADQTLLNCYVVSTAICAATARWAMANSARGQSS